MRAVVFHGPGRKAWEEVPDPEITDKGDVIVRVDARRFITHHFALGEFEDAYDVFTRAAETGALKVALSRCGE